MSGAPASRPVPLLRAVLGNTLGGPQFVLLGGSSLAIAEEQRWPAEVKP
jgi:hypothetical protein